jgi:2-dehydro-3-deoxy-phosphogluconate aldolase
VGTPKIRLNVLARDVENANQICSLAQGRALIGIMVKGFSSVEEAVSAVKQYQQAEIPVSVGLGAGDPAQWKKVAQVAVQTQPDHVNQVFPAAGYTLGALQAIGNSQTLVNALIAPSGQPGKVLVTTGPMSDKVSEGLSCDAAAAMLAEIGVHSVDAASIRPIVQVCLEAGVQQVIPHIYTSIVDKETGLTRLEQVEELLEAINNV